MATHQETGTFTLGGVHVPYAIVRSSKRKRTIALRVHSETGLKILAPQRMDRMAVLDFMQQQSEWILRTLNQAKYQAQQVKLRQFVSGESLPFLGKNYTLRVLPSHSTRQNCSIHSDELIVMIRDYSTETLRRELVITALKKWYRQQAAAQVRERIKIWENRLQVRARNIGISSANKRWGSCSADNVIRISWRIMLAPIALLDYILVHELAHIIHKNHSANFWQLVASVMPDYKTRKHALREYEQDIFSR